MNLTWNKPKDQSEGSSEEKAKDLISQPRQETLQAHPEEKQESRSPVAPDP